MLTLLYLMACGKEKESEPVETTTTSTGCGDPEEFDITIRAKATKGGKATAGLTIRLEERNWEPGTYGEGTTKADGTVEFVASPVTSIANCWGTVLDYWLVADDGTNTVEDDMNTELYNAIDDGSLVSDVRDRPLEL